MSCCDAAGRITVNGVPLDERSYLYPGNQPSAQRFSVTVLPGWLWVMGDYRADSADSRYYGTDPGGGTIPESAVIGRVFLVIWPPAQLKEVPIPATFTQHHFRRVGCAAGAVGRARVPAASYARVPAISHAQVPAASYARVPAASCGRTHAGGCARTPSAGPALGSEAMNDDRGRGDPATTGSQGVGQHGPDADGAVGADREIPGETGTMGTADGQAGPSDGQAGLNAGQAGPADGQASGPSDPAGPSDPPGATGPGARAGASRARKRTRRRISWWTELIALFVLALVIMLVIKTYMIQAFFIPSSSMESTLDVGDKVLVNKLVYHFRPDRARRHRGVQRGRLVGPAEPARLQRPDRPLGQPVRPRGDRPVRHLARRA